MWIRPSPLHPSHRVPPSLQGIISQWQALPPLPLSHWLIHHRSQSMESSSMGESLGLKLSVVAFFSALDVSIPISSLLPERFSSLIPRWSPTEEGRSGTDQRSSIFLDAVPSISFNRYLSNSSARRPRSSSSSSSFSSSCSPSSFLALSSRSTWRQEQTWRSTSDSLNARQTGVSS